MSGPERLIVGFTARGRLGERQRPSGAWGALGLLVSAGCMVAAPEDDAALARRDANVARPDARIDALSLPPVLPPREGFCDSPYDCDDGLLCTTDRCVPAELGSFEGLCAHIPIDQCVEPPDAGPPDARPLDVGSDASRRCADHGLRFSCAVPGGCHSEVGWVTVRDWTGAEVYEGCPLEGEIFLEGRLRGAVVTVGYSNASGPCPGGHQCDAAVFRLEVAEPCWDPRSVGDDAGFVPIGLANLNNSVDGGDRGPFRFSVE
jgi:hypothetical protein